MPNVLSTPKYQNKIGYSGFNMSHKTLFSSTTGELLPIHYDLLNPGDKVRCNIEMITRTMPLQSGSFATIHNHVDWFFVPLQQLLHNFGSWFFDVDDRSSSLLGKPSDTLPVVSATTSKAFRDFYTYNVTPTNQTLNTHFTPYAKFFQYQGNTSRLTRVSGYSLRLLEMFGLPFNQLRRVRAKGEGDLNVLGFSPLFLAAYQKVYFDFYRPSDYEANNPDSFNLDRFFYRTGTNTLGQYDLADNFAVLRFRPKGSDFYTSAIHSPLFSGSTVNGMGINTPDLHQWLTDQFRINASTPFDNHIVPVSSSDSVGGNNVVSSKPSTVVSGSSFSTGSWDFARASFASVSSPANIRANFAYEKLLEITRRAGKHYDAQQLAHFGVKLPTGISGEISYLGSQHSKVDIGDVIASSDSSIELNGSQHNTLLGEIGGKGYGYTTGSDVSFEAPCHGILLGIVSSVVEPIYCDGSFDKLHMLYNRSDFYRPEADNLGMQPLFAYQCPQFAFRDSNDQTDPNGSNIEGWHPRFMELKCKRNVAYGNLQSSLSSWAPSTVDIRLSTLEDRLHSPFELNSLLAVPYNSTIQLYDPQDVAGEDDPVFNDLHDTDPLFHEASVKVYKSSRMSTFGIPNL